MTAEQYLKEHGINKKSIDNFSLTWDSKYLHIPIKDDEGEDLFIKSRNLEYKQGSKEPKYKNSQGSHATLFNYYAVAESDTLVLTEGECFTPEAEILTPTGWLKLKDYEGQEVMQYTLNGNSEFVKPLAYISKDFIGNLVKLTNAQKFYSLTTPDHKLVIDRKGHITKIKADELRADSKNKIPRVTNFSGKGLNLTNEQIELCLAVSADFTIRKGKDLYAGFKKERKVVRIKKILNNLDIPYKESVDTRSYHTFYISRKNTPDYIFKLFPHNWLYATTLAQKKFILEKLIDWDGNTVPNRNQIEYSTKEYQNAVFIQTLAHLAGYTSTIIPRSNYIGKWYKVSILFKKCTTSTFCVKNKEYIPYNGKVYCVQVPSGMLIIRQNDCISISGNCDTIKLMQEGIPAISSTGGAGTFPDEFVEKLQDKKIWICYDNDTAGITGVSQVLEKIPHARVIRLPDDSKDVCEFFQTHDIKEFIKLMKLAQSSIEFKVSFIPEEHKLMSAKELMEKEFPKIPWLIDGIIYSEGFCFLYGAEGIGKSFIALDMAKAVASGKKWLNIFNVPQPVNVLYLDKENPHSLMQRRGKGLGGLPDNLYFLKFPEQFQLHNGKGGASDFAVNLATIMKEKEIGLVVVDSFVDLMVGNESSAEDTQRFFDSLRFLYPEVSFLVLHHENKPAPGTFRNSNQRLRGSSNINAQTFTMFRLEAMPRSKTELTLEQTKARDEQKLDKFLIRMNVSYSTEEQGKTYVSGFDYMGIIKGDFDGKLAEAEEAILDALASSFNGMLDRQTLIETLEASGVSRSTIDRCTKTLIDDQKIEKIREGKKIFYKINSPIESNYSVEGGLL